MAIPRLTFKIDPEREYQYLKMYIEELDSPEFALLPDEIRDEVTKSGMESRHDEIINLINFEWENNFNNNGKIIEDFKSRENQWRKVGRQYFEFISGITEASWEFPEYYCFGSVLSYANFYSMSFGRNEILITIYDTNQPLVKIAHELFHAQQFSIFKALGGKNYYQGFGDNFIETTLILVFTEEGFPFKLNREDLIQERIKYLDEDLGDSLEEIVKLWKNRKSYKDFVLEYANKSS